MAAELAARWRGRHLAYAADHAWLIDCFTRMGELTGSGGRTERAVATADALIARFADRDGGGFFTTADDAEQLIVRTKDVFDGATPSANAVAARPWPASAPSPATSPTPRTPGRSST